MAALWHSIKRFLCAHGRWFYLPLFVFFVYQFRGIRSINRFLYLTHYDISFFWLIVPITCALGLQLIIRDKVTWTFIALYFLSFGWHFIYESITIVHSKVDTQQHFWMSFLLVSIGLFGTTGLWLTRPKRFFDARVGH